MQAVAPDPLAVSQKDAARRLGVTRQTIRNWERRGLIHGRRVAGGVRLYPFAQLRQLIEGDRDGVTQQA